MDSSHGDLLGLRALGARPRCASALPDSKLKDRYRRRQGHRSATALRRKRWPIPSNGDAYADIECLRASFDVTVGRFAKLSWQSVHTWP
jgi:hypothetical protein